MSARMTTTGWTALCLAVELHPDPIFGGHNVTRAGARHKVAASTLRALARRGWLVRWGNRTMPHYIVTDAGFAFVAAVPDPAVAP